MTATTPPDADEVELSVFGPGVGEAVAIHVGNREWVVVDSCVDSRSGEAATVSYLRSIGEDPASCVKWVVATHAHDDHIEGFADLVSACPRANVVLPAASSVEEFLALSEIDDRLTYYQTRWTVYEEYRRTLSELELRNNFGTLFWASAGKELPTGATVRGDSVRLFFVAPSDLAITRSRRILGRLFKIALQRHSGGRLAGRDPNSFSAAVVVHTGDLAFLVGGDVLRGSGTWGWVYAVDTFAYAGTLDAIKVPHHGAPNAYHSAVWTDWPANGAVAVVAPYRPSNRPRAEDIARMASHGLPLFQTARAEAIAPSSHVRQTSGKLRQIAPRGAFEAGGRIGQVRLRWRGNNVSAETLGPAFRAA